MRLCLKIKGYKNNSIKMNFFTPTPTTRPFIPLFPPQLLLELVEPRTVPSGKRTTHELAKVNKPGPGTQKNTGKTDREREGGRERK